MQQLTTEQAIAFSDSRAWEKMTPRERAVFQIEQDRLCMPWSEFQKAVEWTLGRGVMTHEFAMNREGIKAELSGTGPAPTFEQILAMIPAAKPVIVVAVLAKHGGRG